MALFLLWSSIMSRWQTIPPSVSSRPDDWAWRPSHTWNVTFWGTRSFGCDISAETHELNLLFRCFVWKFVNASFQLWMITSCYVSNMKLRLSSAFHINIQPNNKQFSTYTGNRIDLLLLIRLVWITKLLLSSLSYLRDTLWNIKQKKPHWSQNCFQFY